MSQNYALIGLLIITVVILWLRYLSTRPKASVPSFTIVPQFTGADRFDSGGLACVSTVVSGKTKYGYIDQSGSWVIEPKFDLAGSAVDNFQNLETFDFGKSQLAAVGVATGLNHPNGWPMYKFGFINRKGDFVIEPRFDSVTGFYESGLAVVGFFAGTSDDGWPYYKYGFINGNGDLVIEPKYGQACSFDASGLACVREWSDDQFGFIDKSGKFVISPQYDLPGSFEDSHLAPVGYVIEENPEGRDIWRYGFIDSTGAMVIEPTFDIAAGFQASGLAVVGIYVGDDLKWGLIDTTGRYVIESIFDLIYDFQSCDLAKVGFLQRETGGLSDFTYGYIDRSGSVVIEQQFHEAEDFVRLEKQSWPHTSERMRKETFRASTASLMSRVSSLSNPHLMVSRGTHF